MKVYTKTGDKGKTSLIGGTRVFKYDDRIEAYGTLDELNSFIGFLKDQDIKFHHINTLSIIQDRLFVCESLLAVDPEKNVKNIPTLYDSDIEFLEQEIDKMDKELPELKNFILPGGHITISTCHIARTICRRSERITLKLITEHPDTLMGDLVLKYLNRLSDFLFVLSRKITQELDLAENIWKPQL